MTPAGIEHRYGGDDALPQLVTVIFISAVLHMAVFAALYCLSLFYPDRTLKKVKPDAIIVHLLDPGPITGAAGFGRSSVVEAVPAPYSPKLKKVVEPEKILLPLTKESSEDVKKIAVPHKKVEAVAKTATEEKPSSPLKTKEPAVESKKAESVAKEVRERKGGGTIDIRKFPYEWYLRVMESRIYQNWDTLRVNYFSNREVRVGIYFQINRKGNAFDIKVEQSSLNADIDKSAMEAVRLSSPFPPLPPDYNENSLEVHFGFSLNSGH